MKLKHLESELSKIRHAFDQPRIEYEQYSTPPHLAASVALLAYDDLTDSVVLDLGCGKTGNGCGTIPCI
jgi:predicted RNA methylase